MRLWLTLVLIGSSAVATADEVWLKGGGRLVGDVVEKRPGAVVLDVGPGTVTLPLARVERIVSSTVALTDYRERAARLAPGDVGGWSALAQWAEEHDLRTQSREAWHRVLAVDPGSAVAHLALGHVRYQGQWLDFASAQRARGLVEHDGVWMTGADREAALQRDAEARRQAAIADIERQAAEARVREAEARARTAEAEAARAEADISDDGIPFGYGGGYGYGAAVITGPVVQPCGHSHGAGACPGTPGRPGHGDDRPPRAEPRAQPPSGDDSTRRTPSGKPTASGAGSTHRGLTTKR